MTKVKNQSWEIPGDSVGFCYRCNRPVKKGSGWVVEPVGIRTRGKHSIKSMLRHGGECPKS